MTSCASASVIRSGGRTLAGIASPHPPGQLDRELDLDRGLPRVEDEAARTRQRRGVTDARRRDRQAVACYARAMDHVGVMARDPASTGDRVILDLHFDACYFERDRSRPMAHGPDRRHRRQTAGSSTRRPTPDEVPGLMGEIIDWLESGDLDAHVVVRAAMAHLHVVSVHPFRRRQRPHLADRPVARACARRPALTGVRLDRGVPRRTHPRYYDALQQMQGGRTNPSATPPTGSSFCVDAHLAQARRRLDQIEQAARWAFLEQLAEERGWPDRFVIALEQASSAAATEPATATKQHLPSLSDQRLPTPTRRRPSQPTRARTKHPLPRKRRTPSRRRGPPSKQRYEPEHPLAIDVVVAVARKRSSYSDGTGAHRWTLIFRQSFPVGTTVAGSTMRTTVRPRACGRCTMPRGIVTPNGDRARTSRGPLPRAQPAL